MITLEDAGYEVIKHPIKRVRVQFHGGLWYVEYHISLIDGGGLMIANIQNIKMRLCADKNLLQKAAQKKFVIRL
jgi:hypothetical protein